MGLFSSIGGFLGGPFGAAIGGAVDGVAGAIGKRSEAKRSNAAELNKYVRLREASERGGYHPLETLRAGGEVQHTTAPRIMTSLAMGNSFDALEAEFTGEAAKERARAAVDDEIRERQLENLRLSQQRTVGTIKTNEPYDERGTRIGGPSAPPQPRPGFWTGKSIPVVLPTGDTLQMPERLANRLDVKQWDPVIADDLEALAGDEISQVLFGDWLASNGLVVRDGNIEKQDIYTTGDAMRDVDEFLKRPQLGGTTMRDPNPQPGWMDERFK